MPSRYEHRVDANATNNAHSFMLQMVGGNQRVLELGAASGYLTRELAAQGCRVTAIEYDAGAAEEIGDAAETVRVADLNDRTSLDGLQPHFDVVMCGDVLEHLLDPQATLNRAVQLLAPGGRVVVSLPNVAHVDVRLALLQGRFEYRDTGLLDRTHIQFFTLARVLELVHSAGLVITELQRVRVPPFGTELQVEPNTVPAQALSFALEDREAETYQFVFTAVRHDGDQRISDLADRVLELELELAEAVATERTARQAERDQARAAVLAAETDSAQQHERAARAERELRDLYATKTLRLARAPRRVYALASAVLRRRT